MSTVAISRSVSTVAISRSVSTVAISRSVSTVAISRSVSTCISASWCAVSNSQAASEGSIHGGST